ncbi:MAG: hypothetical protein JSR97_11715 [Verrucomicrobia bacterium]|nr:hypothetical protein [Verrucomicrobiota bacterium]
MELEMPKDCAEDLNETFESLIEIRKKIYDLIVDHLKAGECNYLSDDLYGYPYDYELYSKYSLEPNVTILNSLLEKVEQTFEELKKENIPEQNGR